MSIIEFSQSLAQQLYNSTEQFPVDFEQAWEWLGYSRKDAAKRKFLNCGFVEGVDFRLHKYVETREDGTFSHYVENITLTCECLKQWGMMAGTEKGKQVRLYFLECERIAKTLMNQNIQPVLPNHLAIAQVATPIINTFQSLLEQAKQLQNQRLIQQLECVTSQWLDTYFMTQPQNLLADGKPVTSNEPTIKQEGCVDVAIRLGLKLPQEYESALGNYVKKRVRHLALKNDNGSDKKDYRTARVNGKRIGAQMYPAFHPDVEEAVRTYCSKFA